MERGDAVNRGREVENTTFYQVTLISYLTLVYSTCILCFMCVLFVSTANSKMRYYICFYHPVCRIDVVGIVVAGFHLYHFTENVAHRINGNPMMFNVNLG